MLKILDAHNFRRTLVGMSPMAAVLGGVLWLGALLLPFLLPAEQGSGADYRITNVPLYSLFVAMGTVAFLLFPIAVSGLRMRLSEEGRPMGRAGRIGSILVWAGGAVVSVQLLIMIAGAIAGSVSQDLWLYFIGMILHTLGMIVFGISALRGSGRQSTRVLPLLIGVFALLAFSIEADPFHDIAFTLFGLGWVALGLNMRRNSARGSTARRHDGVGVAHDDGGKDAQGSVKA